MTKRSNKFCPKIQSDDDASEGIELNRAAKIHIKSHIKTKPGTECRIGNDCVQKRLFI